MRLQAISPSPALLELQRAAYEVEARLIDDRRIPPLSEDLAALQAAELHWVGAYDGDALVGAVAWREDEQVLDVHRLVVAPAYHWRGIGTLLVDVVVSRAGSRRVVVATGRENAPARRLYEAARIPVPGGARWCCPGCGWRSTSSDVATPRVVAAVRPPAGSSAGLFSSDVVGRRRASDWSRRWCRPTRLVCASRSASPGASGS